MVGSADTLQAFGLSWRQGKLRLTEEGIGRFA
jgi:hypothetical protein